MPLINFLESVRQRFNSSTERWISYNGHAVWLPSSEEFFESLLARGLEEMAVECVEPTEFTSGVKLVLRRIFKVKLLLTLKNC